MLAQLPPRFLLASPEPLLLAAMEPVLGACGSGVQVVLSLDAALDALRNLNAPTVAVVDTHLAASAANASLDQFLAEARTTDASALMSIVLIVDAVTPEWADWLADGIVDDLIPRATEPEYLRVRMQALLRNKQRARELETFREAAALNARVDHLTGVYNRENMLSILFRETDRAQRMKSSLSVLLLDIDDFGHWNERLGNDACDDLLCQVAGRALRVLRSFDVLGRPGKDEFLIVLPGCTAENVLRLAKRLCIDVFGTPFRVGDELVRLSACFGIATSQGRSPVVVLREAETALAWAREAGPESMQFFGDGPQGAESPVAFLASGSGDELLAW